MTDLLWCVVWLVFSWLLPLHKPSLTIFLSFSFTLSKKMSRYCQCKLFGPIIWCWICGTWFHPGIRVSKLLVNWVYRQMCPDVVNPWVTRCMERFGQVLRAVITFQSLKRHVIPLNWCTTWEECLAYLHETHQFPALWLLSLCSAPSEQRKEGLYIWGHCG